VIVSHTSFSRGAPPVRPGGTGNANDALTAGELRIGNIAHDFNNVLTSILGHAELVERSSHLSCADRGRVDQIKLAVQSAGRLAERLVEPVSSPVALDANADPLSLADAIGETLSILSPLLGDRIGCGLHIRAAHAPLGLDRAQLDQLVVNLVVNAVDAMPDGGTLDVSVDDVTLDSEHADDLDVAGGPYLSIRVSDTGVGMTPWVLIRALERFFTTKAVDQALTVDQAMTGSGIRRGGTGRGLTTVAEIVEQLAGAVTIESTVGTGTTVTLYLPHLPRPPERTVTLRPDRCRS
jgi:two-component system, cell cycle sensor histidine kinase and response regulator CckA